MVINPPQPTCSNRSCNFGINAAPCIIIQPQREEVAGGKACPSPEECLNANITSCASNSHYGKTYVQRGIRE